MQIQANATRYQVGRRLPQYMHTPSNTFAYETSAAKSSGTYIGTVSFKVSLRLEKLVFKLLIT